MPRSFRQIARDLTPPKTANYRGKCDDRTWRTAVLRLPNAQMPFCKMKRRFAPEIIVFKLRHVLTSYIISRRFRQEAIAPIRADVMSSHSAAHFIPREASSPASTYAQKLLREHADADARSPIDTSRPTWRHGEARPGKCRRGQDMQMASWHRLTGVFYESTIGTISSGIGFDRHFKSHEAVSGNALMTTAAERAAELASAL